MKLSLFIAIFQLGLLISLAVAADSTISDAVIHQSKTWCVVAPGASELQLKEFLFNVCIDLDCKAINQGGRCFNPNTLQNHASFMLNEYFRAKGVCNREVGVPSIDDPSFGKCRYS